MPRSRMLILTVMLVAASAVRARAQVVPDMSKAPPDVQAVWRKVMSGGIPTPDEARKLSDYMKGHRREIVAGVRARVPAAQAAAEASRRQSAALRASMGASGSGGDVRDCPTRSPALAHVASMAPTAAAAAALLDTLRRTYAALEGPADVRRLDAMLARIPDGSRLSVIGAMLAGGGYADASVLANVTAARRGGMAQLAWTNLGGSLEGAGDDAHAVAAYRRALSLGARRAMDVYGLGVAYADLGDLATALPLLDEAIHLAPRFGMAWDALGRAQSCAGQMTAAIHSMARAQEVDWSEHREAQVTGKESNDDATEAARPLPMATRVALVPPPEPKPFAAELPAIPDNGHDAIGWPEVFLKTANAYFDEIDPILKRAAEDERAVSGGGEAFADNAPGGFGMIIDLSNTREALDAVDRVQQRTSGRLMRMREAYSDRLQAIPGMLQPQYTENENKYRQCVNEARARNGDDSLCKPPYCRVVRSLDERGYELRRDAARIFIGGMAGTAKEYDKALRGWFRFADLPTTRVQIDGQRRSQLAGMEHVMFVGASQVGDIAGHSACYDQDELNLEAMAAKAKLDSAANPGRCKAHNLNLPLFVSVEADCKHLKISVDAFDLPVTPTFEYKVATKHHHGSMFIGVGKDAGFGLASGEVGLQANFDEGGWITTAGIGVHGSLGNSAVISASMDETINLRSTGPAVEGESHATVSPAAIIAMSPNFNGMVMAMNAVQSSAAP